jgi:hypothetical protein
MGGQASSPGRSRSMTARSLSLMSRIFAVQRLSFVPWSVNSVDRLSLDHLVGECE